MTLVFLCGRPAVGKLTVARHVAETLGFRLFHNHLVVDTALALYEFGTPDFVALRGSLWETCFRGMRANRSLSGVVFTFSPESSVPQAWLDEQLKAFVSAGVRLVVVELLCDESVVMSRLLAASRSGTGKLKDPELYRSLSDAGAFDSPVIPGPKVVFDTTTSDPQEVAAGICVAVGRATNGADGGAG